MRGGSVRFARIVFGLAGVWGVLLLLVIFINPAMVGAGGATGSFAQFFYGFLAVTLAWQIAFLLIASNPVRFRMAMLPAIVEKSGYVVLMVWLYTAGRIGRNELSSVVPDAVLGLLFVVAYLRTSAHPDAPARG
jgi:hypothetical protein